MAIVALVGGVGVGKTYFGRKMKVCYPNIIFTEEKTEENLYLSEFYEDMKKWGFHSRISMLSMILSQTLPLYNEKQIVILDRCVNELIVFATKEYEDGNLTEKEFMLYKQLYTAITDYIPQPDLYIFFECSPKVAYDRIKIRGRDCESDVSYEFVEDVIIRYRKWRKTIDDNRVIDINSEKEVDISTIYSWINHRIMENSNGKKEYNSRFHGS